MYYLYILQCGDNTLYTGITVNLARRVKEHESGILGAKYTRGRGPLKLVYSRKYRSRATASKAEYAMKKLSHDAKKEFVKQS